MRSHAKLEAFVIQTKPISMHNSGVNLASQLQLYLLRPSNHAPNETQQTPIKLSLWTMQEELPVLI
jgi:hypothetical protein